MADVKMMNEVNSELNAMADEMVRQRENPRVIRVVQLLAKLTHTGENQQQETQAAADVQARAAAQPEAEEHQHVFNVYGRCHCGFCQHLKVVGGTCLVCDKPVGD